MKKTKAQEPPEIVRAAADLHEALDELEGLTRRVVKQELGTDAELTRAAELLGKSEQAHRAFLLHLASLAQAVEALRQRQNESARLCGERAERLDARRKRHDALAERFLAIGEGAREVNALVQETAGANGQVGGLEEAEQRLAGLVEQAGGLFDEAREAALPELEKQAHAVRQQLAAMQRKIAGLRS